MQNVKVHTPGAVVTTADVLMTLVPDGAGVEVEAQVGNGDIGFVREGQEVAVKLDAFPFTRYGLLKGHVRRLGRNAVKAASNAASPATPAPSAAGVTPPIGIPDLTYPAKVELAQDWIMVDGHREPVQAGMRISAEIKTGDCKVIDYLLSPVDASGEGSGTGAMRHLGRARGHWQDALKMILLTMTLLQAQDMNDCLHDPEITNPPPPLKKIEKCEVFLGFKRDGTDIPCHQVSNGSCEVQ